MLIVQAGNTKGGSITVPLTSCLTGLDLSVLQIKTKIVSSHKVTANSCFFTFGFVHRIPDRIVRMSKVNE